MKWFKRFNTDQWHGVHLAVNVFIATTILWLVLRLAAGVNPIWGITSMLSASEPVVRKAAHASRGIFRNSLIGCTVGLAFVLFGRGYEWSLPIALMATILLSLYVFQLTFMWQQAPITAAIIIAASMSHHSDVTAVEVGIKRVIEVLFGCTVGLCVAWSMSRIWPSMELEK